MRAPEPVGRALEPGKLAVESAGRVAEAAGRVLKPAERPPGASLNGSGVSWGAFGSQLGGLKPPGRNGDGENGAFLVCGGTIGHCPLKGRCPKAFPSI